MPPLCKNKLTVTFKGETVEVNDNDGNVLITGFIDPLKDLFRVSINNCAEEQCVKEKESPMFAGTVSQWIETDYDGVVQSILLTSEQDTAANAYIIANILALISYVPHLRWFPSHCNLDLCNQ